MIFFLFFFCIMYPSGGHSYWLWTVCCYLTIHWINYHHPPTYRRTDPGAAGLCAVSRCPEWPCSEMHIAQSCIRIVQLSINSLLPFYSFIYTLWLQSWRPNLICTNSGTSQSVVAKVIIYLGTRLCSSVFNVLCCYLIDFPPHLSNDSAINLSTCFLIYLHDDTLNSLLKKISYSAELFCLICIFSFALHRRPSDDGSREISFSISKHPLGLAAQWKCFPSISDSTLSQQQSRAAFNRST